MLKVSLVFGKSGVSEAEARKSRSIEVLKNKGIPCIDGLPRISSISESHRRDVKEVALRAMALAVVAEKAMGLEMDAVTKVISRYQLEGAFTPEERKFINSKSVDEKTRIQFIWRYESYWVLLWALGYVEVLEYPDRVCEVPLALSKMTEKSVEAFIKGAKLRSQSEILDQADLILRYHWASREALLQGKEPPAGLDNSVIMERHYTLNWLIEKYDWDEVPTDT